MTLRSYQRAAVEWAKTSGGGLIIAPAGSGKTVIAANILKHHLELAVGTKAGWLAPTLDTCDQARIALGRASILDRVTVRCPHESVTFSDCDFLVVDECFPPETVVSGIQISRVKKGDMVDSFNHKTGLVEKRRVLNVFKTRHNGPLCVVSYSGTQVFSTPNHPFWNDGTYSPALSLDAGASLLTIPPYENGMLSCLQNWNRTRWSFFKNKASNLLGMLRGFSESAKEACSVGLRLVLNSGGVLKPESVLPESGCISSRSCLLQREMQGFDGFKNEFRADVGNKQENGAKNFGVDEGEEGFGRNQIEDFQVVKGDQSQAGCNWRQRKGADRSPEKTRLGVWLQNGTRNRNGWLWRSVCSELLQGGFGLPRNDAGNRGGRILSQFRAGEGEGREEGKGVVQSRLDSVEILQQGDPRWRKQMAGDHFVYNLSIEGNENFFVGTGGRQVLVHNCKHAPAEIWSRNIRSCPGLWFGLDATPWHDRDVDRNAALREMFPKIFEISRDEIGESLADAKLVWRDDTDGGLDRRIDMNIERLMSARSRYMRVPKEELQAMCAWESIVDIGIAANVTRNAACVAYANSHPDSQRLVLVPRVTLGEEYERKIPGSALLHSSVSRKSRREIVNAFRAGDLKCIVATSLADEGLDLPNAEMLVMVSGGRSSQKTIQRASRVLRSFPGKNLATILDFADRFHPIAERQAKKRMASYRSLGCLIETGNKFVVKK
jgi:superfamily II DNA or RNA helicase